MYAQPEVTDAQIKALVEIEERLLGWQLNGAPGVMEAVAAEFRGEAPSLQFPFNVIQGAIFREFDAGRYITVKSIWALVQDCAELVKYEGVEYLKLLSDCAPAVGSAEDGRKQALASLQLWRSLQTALPRCGQVELTRADAVTPTKIEWVWPGWLACGKFHLIAGSPGTGKTTLSLALAATITSGGIFPCGSRSPLGSALMWTGEDDLADSIVPRFLACGGDRSRLHFVTGVKDDNGATIAFDPARDIDRLVASARGIKDLKLLIIDPIVSAVSGDSHKNAETRQALQPLVDFAAQAGIAVLGITHYSKGTSGRDPAERVTGSLAFVAVPRLVMATAKPKEPGDSWRLVRAKSNIGPDGGGFEYDLRQEPVGDQGIYGQCVVWGEALDGTAQALLAEVEAPETGADAPSRKAAEDWLAELLGNGEVRASHVKSKAAEAGHSWATVRRAKKALGVEAIKLGRDAGWAWKMLNTLSVGEIAQPKNGERLSTLEDAQGERLARSEDAHAHGVSTFAVCCDSA